MTAIAPKSTSTAAARAASASVQPGAARVVTEYRALLYERPVEVQHYLNSHRCGPTDFVFLPIGFHGGITPLGSSQPADFSIDPSIAKLCAKQAQEIQSTGRRLELDLDHKGPVMGYAERFFWSPSSGVRCTVDWEIEGAALIISGACPHFSPQHLGDGGTIYGLLPRCGAIVSRDKRPAFNALRYTLSGTTKYKAMIRRAELLIEIIGALEVDASRAGRDFDFLQAESAVKTEFPELQAARELRDHLHAARLDDLMVMNG